MLGPDAWVPLAEVARPHGVQGELRLRLFNGDSDLLLDVAEVLVRPAAPQSDGRQASPVRVESSRRANDAILLKLYDVDDRDAAARLRGALVCARRGEFPPLGDGEFYACDVEGARVVLDGTSPASPERGQASNYRELGRVLELRQYPTVDTLLVEASDGGGPWEVPLVDTVVQSMNLVEGVVVLFTLDGVERS
jgi:16S rRNA processing protein RimM